MIQFIKTNSENTDFKLLVKELDAYLAEKDGDEHDFYNQYNQVDAINCVILAYEENKVLACGGMKEFSSEIMEIKRMFTLPSVRGVGLASKILAELEYWALELGYQKCILETGKRQIEAIELYKKNKYQLIPNYAQYIGMDNSLCFEKIINQK